MWQEPKNFINQKGPQKRLFVLGEFMFDIPSQVKFVLNTLKHKGFEAYLVGGCVRDYLMGKTPSDFDVTTSALPQDIVDAFPYNRTFTEGKAHGTVAVLVEGMKIEITTYRSDGEYKDSRHPDSVLFGVGLNHDLERRDFTVNAIAYDGANTVDLFGGAEDIKQGIIRAVGAPEKRFSEDALRILRALRFSSTLGFEIEEKTANAARKYKNFLKNISTERITSELFKILCGDNVEDVLLKYSDILDVFLPGVHKMHAFDQRNKYHMYDVLTHTAKTVVLCPKEPVIRLAALLHDVGKPVSCQEEPSGYRHFKGHPDMSLEITKAALENLSLKTSERQSLLFLVKEHDEFVGDSRAAVKRWLNRYGVGNMRMLCHLKLADAKTHNTLATDRVEIAEALTKTVENILEKKECYQISMLDINGNDLIKLGFKGTQIGAVLEDLLEKVIQNKLENSKCALISHAKQIKR